VTTCQRFTILAHRRQHGIPRLSQPDAAGHFPGSEALTSPPAAVTRRFSPQSTPNRCAASQARARSRTAG
jgi:hypothetical protein